MHLFDLPAGILASVPIVGSAIPLGVGAALAAKQNGEETVSVVFIGDGTVEEGVFHESVNFSVVHKLPVIFVVENNLYSVYTPLSERQPERALQTIGASHGLHAGELDGNDVVRIHEAAEKLIKQARNGDGPSLLVCNTYRWREHCGPNYDNDLGYRSEAEFERWREKCPIESFAKALRKEGLLTDQANSDLTISIMKEIEEAMSFAQNSPLPDPNTASNGVYAS